MSMFVLGLSVGVALAIISAIAGAILSLSFRTVREASKVLHKIDETSALLDKRRDMLNEVGELLDQRSDSLEEYRKSLDREAGSL